MKKITAILVAVGGLAGLHTASAAPFEAKDVGADPGLLLHVDCDALKSSTIGQALLAQSDVKDKVSALAALFDFDIRTQLHGLTVYTTENHPKDGVLIIYADFDANRLVTLAKGNDGFETVTNGSHVIYSWIDKKKQKHDGDAPRICGAIAGHRVIFGQSEARLSDALAVIDGGSKHFAGKGVMEEPASGETIIAQGAALKFDFGDSQQAVIFQMSKMVRLKISENGGKMTASVHLVADKADSATQITAIAQGLLAVLKLQKDNDDALKLANNIVIKQDGPAVGISLSAASSDLLDLIKQDEAKAKEKEEQRAERRAGEKEQKTNSASEAN